jgi:stage II sporulation protein D
VLRSSIWLVSLLAGCKLGETLPTTPSGPEATTTGVRREPSVRVGIKIDTAVVTLAASTTAEIVDRDGKNVGHASPNERWTFTAASDGSIGMSTQAGQSMGSLQSPVSFRPSADGFVTIGDKVYRGDVVIRAAGPGRVTAINVLEMEQYLLGVVPFEIGRLPAAEIEAIKAQAIAARTYAIGNMNSRGALGFDFYATVADQVYGGTSGEDSVVSRAVRETAGEIITHNGQPILAYYSSTCAGHTADVDESWPWRPGQAYLKGKPDTDAAGEAYCKFSRRFRWSVSWPGDSLRMVLQQTLGQRLRNPTFTITRISDVQVTGRSNSGRAEAVAIIADGMTYRVPADSIRWVLRPTVNGSLNSSLIFDLKATQTNGEVTRLDVSGGGWGHGVGMCQVGAIGRARAGQSYRQILGAYYTDTEVARLY